VNKKLTWNSKYTGEGKEWKFGKREGELLSREVSESFISRRTGRHDYIRYRLRKVAIWCERGKIDGHSRNFLAKKGVHSN